MYAFKIALTKYEIGPGTEPKNDFYHFSFGLGLGILISYSDRSEEQP